MPPRPSGSTQAVVAEVLEAVRAAMDPGAAHAGRSRARRRGGGGVERAASPGRRPGRAAAREAGARPARRRAQAVRPSSRDGHAADEKEAAGSIRRAAHPRARDGGAARVRAGREVHVLHEVPIAGQGEADTVSSGREPAAHEASPLRIGGADQLVVHVDAGARRLGDDFEHGGGRPRGRRWRAARAASAAPTRSRLAPGRLRGAAPWGAPRERRPLAAASPSSRRARERGAGGGSAATVVGGRRSGSRRRRARPRARRRGQRVHLGRQPPSLLRRLPRPRLGPLERGPRAREVVQLDVGLGQLQVRVVLALDVRPVGDDVAPGLRPLADRVFEEADRARRPAPGPGP